MHTLSLKTPSIILCTKTIIKGIVTFVTPEIQLREPNRQSLSDCLDCLSSKTLFQSVAELYCTPLLDHCQNSNH